MAFFRYEFNPLAAPWLRVLGVRPDRDGVRIDNDRLSASFGFLSIDLPLSNISSATVTGPYRWFKAIGPRLSIADHGLTFGTTADQGVCITVHEPIPRVIGPWNHPGVTLTVQDPAALVEAISNPQS